VKRDLYIKHDSAPIPGMQKATPEQALRMNEKGYGVFWTVNEFDGDRTADRLVRINSWYVEIDDMPKSEQIGLITQSPLTPSLVIESKNGFHIYWNAKDAKLQNYRSVLKKLRSYFLADERAQDIARVLRAPGYNHMKDPTDPFKCEVVWQYESQYNEALINYLFPDVDEETQHGKPTQAQQAMAVQGDDFWTRVYSLDCEFALHRLSGQKYVNGEVYTFAPTSRGFLNVLVDGKPSSVFIDDKKRIGSSSKGGPSIFQWLKWFGHSNREVYAIIKEVFPEVFSR
jgi:hypothetical protein